MTLAPALTTNNIRNCLAALAIAAALVAPAMGLAMDGGRGGRDTEFRTGSGEGRERRPDDGLRGPQVIQGPAVAHGDDHFRGARPRDARFYDGGLGDGAIARGERPDESAYADHRWPGPIFDEVSRDWPTEFLFGPHMYGAHDSQFCTRRDVYGDLYQAC